MTEEMKFFMYLLEYYAFYKNKKTRDVLNEWEKCGIIMSEILSRKILLSEF